MIVQLDRLSNDLEYCSVWKSCQYCSVWKICQYCSVWKSCQYCSVWNSCHRGRRSLGRGRRRGRGGSIPAHLIVDIHMPSNRLSNMNQNILMSDFSKFIILIITYIWRFKSTSARRSMPLSLVQHFHFQSWIWRG